MSAAGDVNSDGGADLLIGAFGAPDGSFSGASYVVFGEPPPPPPPPPTPPTPTRCVSPLQL
ncbi:MAG: FG-GAP repeat protein [Gammaproteobacteria bacterium]|nr:FG-GAP repeat protein [Gammaproteobacteria bacterium]